MPLWDLQLDRDDSEPLYRQIVREVEERVDRQVLHEGVKLPSSRELAQHLQVHRTTVTAAYRELTERGVVTSGVGQGTFIAEGIVRQRSRQRGRPWTQLSRHQPSASFQARVAVTDRTRLLDRAVPDPDLYPIPQIRESFEDLLRLPPEHAFSYGPPAGHERLRAALIERLQREGLAAEGNDLLIVGGSQQGIDLVARLLLSHGGTVLVDAPTYRGALEVFRLNGARIVPLPLRLDRPRADGAASNSGSLDFEALEEILERRDVELIYTMPTFHNPTGLTFDADERRQLYELAAAKGVPILEDDWVFDLRRPEQPAPVKSLDESGIVIHCGTFSKTAVPGFRVGWLLAPQDFFGALLNLKSHCDLSTSLIGQQVLAHLMETPAYDQHVDHVRAVYQSRLDAGLAALARYMPESVRWTHPCGGIVNWLQLPPPLSGFDIARDAALQDVLVSPGEIYLADGGLATGLRLCYSLCEPAALDQAIATLAEIIRNSERTASNLGSAPLV